MSRLALLALSAGLSIALAQTDQRPTTPTTGPNTTGTPDMGATVPGQVDREKPGEPHRTVAPPRGDHETGTPVAGSAVSGPATVRGNTAAGAAASGPTLPAGSAATAPQTTGHIPARPVRAASTATTHSGSTPIAADQSDVRTPDAGSADRSMPDTSTGWLAMLLGGGMLSGAGLALRRLR